ncbi:MAG: homoserine dehydrogenase [Chloroflexi bacterium]|nr:homoserine dehydrogenase [Chloroflexota bacterium]
MTTPVTTCRVILIGFGAVGHGFATILAQHGERLRRQSGIDIRIVAVATHSRGAVIDPAGIDLAGLLASAGHAGGLAALPGATRLAPTDIIRTTPAEVVVEATWTDLATGEPAISHIRAAFAAGMHAITVNKGPAALALQALRAEAAACGRHFGFEGTVMAGTPSLRLALEGLQGCAIHEVRGIVNGTTNFILSQMERGMDYATALAEAQRLGYAEADPTGDVEGFDAAGKAAILANALLGAALRPADVARQGISQITAADVAAAAAAGERWRLIARVWRDADQVRAAVAPTRLAQSHPLAGVTGATNALTISTDLLGDVTLIGPGAGGVATGFAIVSDILALYRNR